MRVLVIALFHLLWFGVVHASVNADPVPGGVALVPLGVLKTKEPPAVFFEEQRVTVIATNELSGDWHAVVGIPLGKGESEESIWLRTTDRFMKIPFKVQDKSYPYETIRVQQKYVTPPKAVFNRIQDEAKHLNMVLSQWGPTNLTDLKLIIPVKGRVSSEFGVHRVLNGQPRSYHKGIDYAAPIGTVVSAAREGIVVDKGEYYYTGNTIVVDHGQSFKTIYCHLDQFQVEKGEQVLQGQAIGTVGQSGRASGPHLHFGVSLNNTRVSPELFF